MADFEPVEIDFMYGGNTQAEGKKIEKSMDDIANASKKAQADITAAAKVQSDLIKQIESDIKDLESKVSKAAPGAAKMELTETLAYAKRALEEEKGALNDLNASVEATAEKHTKLRTQVMEAKQALSEMEMAGKRGTPEYNEQARVLGELNDQYNDTATQAKILADDEKGFKGVASAVSGVSGAMSAAVGVAALFGAENEDLARIQMRLQAVMAITIGVQQVAEMLNKDSYFSVVLLAKGKDILAAAELKLAAATGISTAAARTFMIATGAVAIVAIAAFAYAIMKVSDAHKEQTKAATDAAKKEQEASAEIASGYAKEKSKIEALIASIHSENVKRGDKMKMITQLKNMIPGYTAELSKEGTVIRENKKAIDDYMVSLEKSLKLKAAEKELEAIYTKMYKLEKLSNTGEKEGNQFTKNLADQDQGGLNQQDIAIRNAKKGIAKGAQSGVDELQKEADRIKEYISKTGLVSEEVIKKISDKAKKSAKEQYDAEKAITDLLLDIRAQRTKLELDQQTDSLQKRLAAIEFEKTEEIRKIEEKEAAIVAAYNKSHKGEKGFVAKTTLAEIDPTKAGKLSTEKDNIKAAYRKQTATETKKWNDEILKLATEFADERIKIAEDYNEKIKKLEENGQKSAADLARKERDKKIGEVTKGNIEETELYKLATNEKLQISQQMTERLLDQLRERIAAEWAAGKLTVDQMNKLMDEVNKAQETVSAKKIENNPFAQLRSAISGNTAAQQAFKNAPAGTTDEALAQLEDAANKARSSMASAAAEALNGVNAILGSVVGGLDQLGMLTDEQKKDAENVIGMVDGAANIAMGIATGNPMAVIQGSVDLLVNAIEFFDFKNKALEKSQRAHMKNVKDLELKYKKLQRAVETALGTDVYKAQRAEIENQKKQIQEYEAWLVLESQKKKKKQDADKIAETKAKIDEIKNSIEDEAKAIAEALAQTDAKSLANELADAITTAFMNSEDAALAFGDVAEQVMQNAVKNALKLQFLEKPMQNAVDQLSKDMESGGSLSDAEQAAFRKKIEDAGKVYYEQLAQYSDLFTGSADVSQTGIKGDVAKMTEETGSALVGQITALRFNVAGLLANSKSSLDQVSRALDLLGDIRSNTDRLQRIDETLYYLKINGIKVN